MQSRLLGTLAGITLLAATNLAAQRPQTREGFWISLGGGTDSLSWGCDGCSSRDHGGGTINLRLGGTPSQQFLLGAELNEVYVDIGLAEIRAGYGAFTMYWYPSATGGLFVKGGVGVGTYVRESDSSKAQSTSAAILLGTGYDIRVGRKISVNPMLTLWSSNKAYLKENRVPIETGFRQSGVTLQLGITFHDVKFH